MLVPDLDKAIWFVRGGGILCVGCQDKLGELERVSTEEQVIKEHHVP